jgi:hypothetical protein
LSIIESSALILPYEYGYQQIQLVRRRPVVHSLIGGAPTICRMPCIFCSLPPDRSTPDGVVAISRGLSPPFADDTPGAMKIQIHFDPGGVASPLRVAIALNQNDVSLAFNYGSTPFVNHAVTRAGVKAGFSLIVPPGVSLRSTPG